MGNEPSLRKLLSALHLVALGENKTRNEQWIKTSYIVGRVTGGHEFVRDTQEIGTLDILLISLEKEFLTKQDDSSEMVDHSFHYYANLSRSWVGQTYELMRCIKQRLLATPKAERKATVSEEFLACFRTLEAIRVVLFKREIAGGAKMQKQEPIILRQSSSSNPIPYQHGLSSMTENAQFFPTLGCIGWHVFGANLPKSGIIVSRTELSAQVFGVLKNLED